MDAVFTHRILQRKCLFGQTINPTSFHAYCHEPFEKTVQINHA